MPKILNVQNLESLNPANTFLVLVNPDKIPHIVLVHKGVYFALTYKESVKGEDFAPYLRFLQKEQKKVIFMDLGEVDGDPRKQFEEFESVQVGATTCFIPVRNFLEPQSESRYAFELVPELYEKNRIQSAFQINLDSLLDADNNFEMEIYDKDSIYAYIQSLKDKHAEREANISSGN